MSNQLKTSPCGGGQPVEEHVFHRLYLQGGEPAYAPAVRGDADTFIADDAPADVAVPAPDAAEAVPGTDDTPAAEEAEERRRSARQRPSKKGLIIVNTGEGKGKTTAALGIMTRAWGRGMRVGVIQFLKNENAGFGEIRAARKMGVEIIPTGDGFTWTSKDLDESAARAVHGWEIAKERIAGGDYDVLILDEFTYLLHFGWLDMNQVLQWLGENKPPMLHLVITGRYAPAALIDFADLVTEMREIKHPLKEQGLRAQPGIEF